MANRNFTNSGKLYSMLTMPVMLNCKIVIGASGAVASIETNSLVKSVTRSATGTYVVNLMDNYAALIIAQGSAISPSSGTSGIVAVEASNDSTTTIKSLSAPKITVRTLNASDAAADPASGSIICIMAIANNSSIKS